MKEPIQQSGHEVSIVIYDAPLPPRYLKFSKKFIRTLFVIVPLTIGLIFMGLLVFGLGSRLKEAPTPSLPAAITDDESKISVLESEIESLKQSNETLQERLSTAPAAAAAEANQEEPFLMGIKKPYGMQNLIAQNKVSLDQFALVQESNKTVFKFQIISNQDKVTGHVLVFMISDNGMMIYPAPANSAIGGGVKFSMGEPFSVSRLRPTNAEFLQGLKGGDAKFVIYIFSREGDLLLVKETETYKVGAK